MLELKAGKLAKYQQIEQDFLVMIRNGEVPVGDQFPTEASISDRYGVSRLTVRKAIGNLQQQGYLVRQPGRGTFVKDWRKNGNYHLNLRKDIAALYVDMDSDNLWNMRTLQAASLEAERHGYHVTFCGVTGEQLSEGIMPLAFREATVSGVFISGDLTDLQMKYICEYDIPCLFLGNYEHTHGQPAISFDVKDMAYRITRALLEKEKGPVSLVVEPFRLYYTRQIYEGYQEALFESTQSINLLNACQPKDCAAIVKRLKESGQKKHCLIVMPTFVQGLLDHLKVAGIDMSQVTMVVIGQREPWWHHDDQLILCEIQAEMMATEAVKQLTASFEQGESPKNKMFKLSVDSLDNDDSLFRFTWS